MFAFLLILLVAGCAWILLACCLLTLLQKEGLLIKDQVVEDAGEEDAFKHDQVADDFTSQEGVLQFLVLDEIVEPLFTESWHAAHLEEV